MEDNINNLGLILENTETIIWLLTTIVVISALFLIAFSLGLLMLYVGGKAMLNQHGDRVFRIQSEDYLGKNLIKELEEHCQERLESHPNDVWAHWYIGQAHYHSSSWQASKRSFERALELEPSWYSSIDSWLEKLSDKISEAGPKLVE